MNIGRLQLPRNPRKTERGVSQFLIRLAVRAAPIALPILNRLSTVGGRAR
jgi:hypothetical protein